MPNDCVTDVLQTLDELRGVYVLGQVQFVSANEGSGSGAAMVVAAAAQHGMKYC